jgi:O-methyltransferase
MIGMVRSRHLVDCVKRVLLEGVEGDLLEAGVWRGGASILMRGVLEALGDCTRNVWLADSFEGLPKPDPERYPADEGDDLWSFEELAVSVDEVKANFARYGLLDERVRFLKGWFEDTLPVAPVESLALLRVDGDLYSSTTQALNAMYPKLSVGGYCIVDDYGAVPACREAVEDFRKEQGIDEPIEKIDWTGVAWRRG